MSKQYFVGWSSDYDRMMIETLTEHFECEIVNLPFILRALIRILDRYNFYNLVENLSSIYVRFRLRHIRIDDLILCKDTNFYRYIEAISSYENNKVLILRNIVEKSFVDKYNSEFNAIFSFDKEQCNNYQVKYLNQIFPLKDAVNDSELIESNRICYFLGADKGRIGKIEEIADMLEALNWQINFKVVKDVGSTESKYYINKYLPYSKNLEFVKDSSVLLEINQNDQSGITLRTLESIFYGKKLITNNAAIKQYDFYDEKLIYILNFELNSKQLQEFLNSEITKTPSEILYRYTPKSMLEEIHKYLS